MKTHYIPRLLLRKFATGEKINTYDFSEKSFKTKKIKFTFAEDDLFDSELERAFASRLEGPVGNLLHHKLLGEKKIAIDRKENMLLRKFVMINSLRAPIVNGTWDEMVERTRLQEHPSVQIRDFFVRHNPEIRAFFEGGVPSADSYLSDLKTAMEYNTLEDILYAANEREISRSLWLAVQQAMVSVLAFWDCEGTGQEFILPKLPGISMMDQVSILYKQHVLRGRLGELEKIGITQEEKSELERLIYGSMTFSDNFSIYPISPTRALICISPYFRAFFSRGNCSPFLKKEQFDRHFFEPMRMELFEPCQNAYNQFYDYEVKQLTANEVLALNSILLDMETEEFAFHDYNKIRDSFWYYDNKAKFAMKKKHNFSHMG